MADGEKNPKLEMKSIKIGESVVIKLDCIKPVKTGENSFGTWNMWFGFVDGSVPVTDANKKEINGYKGKAIFFPNRYINDQLLKATKGINTDVEVKITKTVKDGPKGPVYNYEVEKLSEGKPFTSFSNSLSSSLTEIEQSFVNEMLEITNEGTKISEELAIKAARDPNYQISKERAIELYSLIKK